MLMLNEDTICPLPYHCFINIIQCCVVEKCMIEYFFIVVYTVMQLKPLACYFFTDELFKVHKLKPTQKWRQQFDNYLKTMPIYYSSV